MVRALIVKDGKYAIQHIDQELEKLQELVEGYIEVLHEPCLGFAIICNEEGAFKYSQISVAVRRGTFSGAALYGPIVVVGYVPGEPDFSDVPDEIAEDPDKFFSVL